ncbi:MAG: ORF6N domain-containing protein [Oscillospiraceae bacterium]|nr:ORF6N domain-containing protein [Oscillospiraceae bacterium]
MREMIRFKEVEKRVLTLRGQQVLLDRDVAELYGVEVKRVNEAVKRNPDKFPEGYIIMLCDDEKLELVANCDRFDMLKHSTVLPAAFSEKGLYMLATILKSPSATQTTLAIVETFTKIREFARVVADLPDIKEETDMNTLVQRGGDIFIDILENSIMEVTGDEISIELDLPIVKLKRIIKREKRKQDGSESQ